VGSNLLKRHLDEVVNVSWNFAGRCDTTDKELMNAVLGLAGESGEVADQFKKFFFHTKDAKNYRDSVCSELGDVMYYWLKTVELMGLTPEEVLQVNREKLESRHPEFGKVTERFGARGIK
jgi:NTP pyrophosphatase (non-canonical NTP hydrolase)